MTNSSSLLLWSEWFRRNSRKGSDADFSHSQDGKEERPQRPPKSLCFQSHLPKSHDDGSQHDDGGVEDGPEEERDGQTAHLRELLYV